MGSPVLVVSLGRLIADHVRLEPAEACAVLLKLWDHLARAIPEEGAIAAVPSLDAVGITAFGDFEVHRRALSQPEPRTPEDVASDMAALLSRLLASGRDTLAALPAQVVAACRVPTVQRGLHTADVAAPARLLDALAAHRPADPSAALAMVFARWMRSTDGGAIRGASRRSGA